ncbi:putative extracellular lipase [Ilyonectria robusta]|uniref:putative extracellular lipase n=1 Tax=Ilyonectria robusta TaxID=1079257 RepID=UPI001E8DC497|nr:putative extracellular lipase [Ilyonectria robusta]KAH8661828.1 putative extracellular lipase [Ilyonectria robusta]
MQLSLIGAAVLLAAPGVLAKTKHEVLGPIVRIRNGTIVGKYVETYDQDLFLGIPFAQPPIGDLRFNAPQPINETWTTPLNATAYGAHCINYLLGLPLDPADLATRYPQSEDCLTINVVRPAGTKSNARLPVLTYIYGGGFQEGGSGDARYNASALVQKSVQIGQPSIVVTMNYRLQGWGFLAGNNVRNQGLLNLGIQDQRLALRWIQDNIATFGGDRQRVTIQGESAGAASVGFHLLANGGRNDGLFSAAICQSGGPYFFGSFTPDAQSEKAYESVLKAANCTDAHDTLQCLRAAPLEILNTTFAGLSFLPVIDGTLVPEYSSTALAKGRFVKVPLLIGTNTDEGKIFAGMGVNTTDEFAGYITQYPYIHTANNQTIRDLLEAYPELGTNSTHGQSDDTLPVSAPYGDQFLRTARYTGDAIFIAGRRYTCQIWTEHGVHCYSYRFNTIPGGTDPLYVGATHFEEIAFVFDNVLGMGMTSNAFDVEPIEREESYKKLSDMMGRMWMSFAATHSPNNHKVKSFRTAWPAYSLKNPRNMVFDGNATSFVEKDDWRTDALKLIIERSLDFGR